MPEPLEDTPLSAVMGAGARYEGDLVFEGRVRVDGHFVGRIYTEDLLEVGAQGTIEGAADVANARVAGRMVGEIRVREHLVVEATGVIEGHLDAGVVDLHPGAKVDARVRIRGEVIP